MRQILIQIETELNWVPSWVFSLVILAVFFAFGLFVHRVTYRILTRLVATRDLFWRSLVQRTERPARLLILVMALAFAVTLAPLSYDQASVLRHGLLIAFIAVVAWIAKTALHIWTIVYLRRYKLDAEDNLMARKHVTQSRIMERIASLIIVVVGFAAALMTFPAVQQYGVSLLASAGVAGIVLGLALQPVLKNLLAGIQLAITQPIRIDDALLVEGEWGKVEEITSTYVVVKLWDWRRLVLPLSYFIEKPFQNWTRETASLIGTVMVYLDYDVPVAAIRSKAEEIVAASPLWDRDVINVAVTDLKEQTMEIRILCSAPNSGMAFDLRCEMREKMIDFIRTHYPGALPRMRTEIAATAAGTGAGIPMAAAAAAS
ncbi:mechanosensitive ion channel protein MscS [Rhizobium rhizosphaerae]|uniref:Mechanosensitive ion channel protein MscS n=1 Tax=Xaviernesmea rhizosphaerae TaxID=1672749 RepID=A0A1Q9AN98_9HYPH|nr:mechanosensitive ion channel domain-containing protein [Xaviernesmea rhizosphaerae]OLP56890.1 mechanosensitive ion channel protein MscS [Xaviernesmea rhizosphaerae]